MPRENAPLSAPPNPLPKIAVEVPFIHAADSAWTSGTLNWTVVDAVVNVTDDNGRNLGYIQACFGGFLEVHINRPDGGFELWRLDPRDAWYAVVEASARARGKASEPDRPKRKAPTKKQ
jgi:hypothetical protein